MTFFPIVGRELRVSARTASTYWLRIVGATVLLAAGASYWMVEGVRYGASTGWFMAMHLTLFWTIWVLVPVMTADCISRERREGTLGLLFLASLKAGDIVLAKGFVHGLRATTLCIAGIPVLVLPFLTGGVGWILALSSVLINLSSLCWALGAGVLASSRVRTFTRAVAGAMAMATISFIAMGILQGGAMVAAWLAMVPRTATGLPSEWGQLITIILEAGFMSLVEPNEIAHFISNPRGPVGVQIAWLYALSGVALVSLLGLVAAVRLAAFNVRRNWQDKPRSALQRRLEKEFCTPAYSVRLFRGWMRRLLERNPIGWLERRTWQARTVSWAWLAVIISVYSAMLGSTRPDRGSFQIWQWVICALFCASLITSATGSFRRERESGVMELLLVSPLSVGQIINGRLRGIWSQFLPALILFVVVQFHLISIARTISWNTDASMGGALVLWLLGSAMLTLPVIGLYFSLHCRLHITAMTASFGVGVALPAMVTSVMGWLDTVGFSPDLQTLAGCLVLITMIAFVWVLVRRRDLRPALVIGIVAWMAILAVVSIVLVLDNEWTAQWSIARVDRRVPHLLVAAMLYALLQSGSALWLGMRLHQSLEQRRFSLPQ